MLLRSGVVSSLTVDALDTLGSMSSPQHSENNASQHKNDPALLESGEKMPDYLPGYAEVAAFVSLDRDGGLYHRFRTLSARNILYMQGQLASLADRLDVIDKMESAELRDRNHPAVNKQFEISMCATDWDTFKDLSSSKDGNAKERMGIIREMRPLLRDYCRSGPFNFSSPSLWLLDELFTPMYWFDRGDRSYLYDENADRGLR